MTATDNIKWNDPLAKQPIPLIIEMTYTMKSVTRLKEPYFLNLGQNKKILQGYVRFDKLCKTFYIIIQDFAGSCKIKIVSKVLQ